MMFSKRRIRYSIVAAVMAAAISSSRSASAKTLPAARLRAPPRPIPLVVVLRRPGLTTYERVTEEFRSHMRAAVRVLSVRRERRNRHTLKRWLLKAQPNLLFVVGQAAYDFVIAEKLPTPLLHALVLRRDDRAGHHAINSAIPAQAVLAAFRVARPRLRAIAVLRGPNTHDRAAAIRSLARKLGIGLRMIDAETPAEAIRVLRVLPRDVDGLWLLTDLALLTPKVVQYSVGQQFRRRLPLMGATRHHVKQGALFAIDWAPDVIGRKAAALATTLLGAGTRSRRPPRGPRQPLSTAEAPRMTLNLRAARRLGVDIIRLRAMARETVE